MNPSTRYLDPQSLLETCRSRSVELLKRNMSPGGILAASPSARADKRGYTAIFGRDAAVCAIGMALSGDKTLERAAAAGVCTHWRGTRRRTGRSRSSWTCRGRKRISGIWAVSTRHCGG